MYLSQIAMKKVFQNYQIVFVCEKEGKIVPQNNVTYVTSAPTNNNSWLRLCNGRPALPGHESNVHYINVRAPFVNN